MMPNSGLHIDLDHLENEAAPSYFMLVATSESSLLCLDTFFPVQTATLQVLRKAGRPSERAHAHANKSGRQQCSHSHEEENSALELAELEAEYDAAYKEATRVLQEARTAIHESMEEVRYEVSSTGAA